MDKSFNDQELSDIMKEIESLEEGFKAEESSHSPVLEELVEFEEEKVAPVAEYKQAEVFKMKSHEEPKASAPTTMSFKVSGQMNLELQFDIGGKVVCLEVSEHGLSIQMEGGMTFNVPVHDKKVA
jgi:hypothetical protein